MSLVIDLVGNIEASAKKALNPGSWYLGFECRDCKGKLALFDDPADTGETRARGAARFSILCPTCGGRHVYAAADVATFQAAIGGVLQDAKA